MEMTSNAHIMIVVLAVDEPQSSAPMVESKATLAEQIARGYRNPEEAYWYDPASCEFRAFGSLDFPKIH
jgi:hypothetical protein